MSNRAGFTYFFLRNATNGMNLLQLSGNTRNAAKSELIEQNLVHFRFKFSGFNIRIVVTSIAVNTQGVGF